MGGIQSSRASENLYIDSWKPRALFLIYDSNAIWRPTNPTALIQKMSGHRHPKNPCLLNCNQCPLIRANVAYQPSRTFVATLRHAEVQYYPIDLPKNISLGNRLWLYDSLQVGYIAS